VVVFLMLARVAAGAEPTVASIAWLFVEEAVGGVLFGVAIGYLAYRMLRSIDNYQVEVMITLALVLGGYALASAIHVSGPLAMVVSGLFIGNTGRSFAMSETTRRHLDTFWELLDEILNGVLFMLIGFELVVLSLDGRFLMAGAMLIPVVLLVRFVSVGAPFVIMRRFMELSPHAIKVLTWGGIRGGISVALALGLPASPERQLILTTTYVVVLFSIVVQGLTLGRVVRSVTREAAA
jgi:CPA1 family monovalent cation:H+ antiporter